MSRIMTFVGGMPRKFLYTVATVVISAALAAVQQAHPSWVLPSAEQIIALGGGLLACHTLTDVFALARDAVLAYMQTKRVAHNESSSAIASMIQGVMAEALKAPAKP